MRILAEVFVGVAAAALFFLLEPVLLGFEQPWRLVGTAVIFIAASGIAFYVSRRIPKKPGGDPIGKGRVLAGNVSQSDLIVDVDNLDATRAKGTTLSDNKAGGKATITVKNSKF